MTTGSETGITPRVDPVALDAAQQWTRDTPPMSADTVESARSMLLAALDDVAQTQPAAA